MGLPKYIQMTKNVPRNLQSCADKQYNTHSIFFLTNTDTHTRAFEQNLWPVYFLKAMYIVFPGQGQFPSRCVGNFHVWMMGFDVELSF